MVFSCLCKFIKVTEIVADLEKPEECRRVVDVTVSRFGQLDVLVNSAGYLMRGSIETLSLEDFDKQMNINVRSVFVVTQAAVPHLKTTKGNIVNISSVTGHRAVKNYEIILYLLPREIFLIFFNCRIF